MREKEKRRDSLGMDYPSIRGRWVQSWCYHSSNAVHLFLTKEINICDTFQFTVHFLATHVMLFISNMSYIWKLWGGGITSDNLYLHKDGLWCWMWILLGPLTPAQWPLTPSQSMLWAVLVWCSDGLFRCLFSLLSRLPAVSSMYSLSLEGFCL